MLDLLDKILAAKYSNKRVELAKKRLKYNQQAKKNAMTIRELDAQTERLKAEIKVTEAAYRTGLQGLRQDTRQAIKTLNSQAQKDQSGNLLSGVEGTIRARLSGG